MAKDSAFIPLRLRSQLPPTSLS